MTGIEEILAPANWELTAPKDKLFSSDHVIDAYLKGKNDGLEQQQKLVIEKLVVNIKKSTEHTSNVLSYLKKEKFHPLSAYLRINSWDDFTMLIVLPQKEFIDEKILKVYNYISKVENMAKEEMYNIQITICDTENKVDENYIRSDGFALKHIMPK